MAGQPSVCGWPRLEAEAGGRPTLDLALLGRIKAEEGASTGASGRLLSTWRGAFEQLEQRCGGAEEVRRPG